MIITIKLNEQYNEDFGKFLNDRDWKYEMKDDAYIIRIKGMIRYGEFTTLGNEEGKEIHIGNYQIEYYKIEEVK